MDRIIPSLPLLRATQQELAIMRMTNWCKANLRIRVLAIMRPV